MTAGRILQRKGNDVISITSEATIADALEILVDRNIGVLLVSNDGQSINGIISERDIMRAMRDNRSDVFGMLVAQYMTEDVRTCLKNDPARSLLAIMTEQRIRHLPVTENGKLIGIVSIGDVVKYRLDEIVAEGEAMRDYITRG